MANYFARKAGNINATDVWATTPSGTAGAQTFVAGDVLYANSFAITVNVSTDLGSTGQVRNDNTNGATGGGSFTLSNGVTLTANVFQGSVTSCIAYSGTSGNSATVNGNVNGSTIASNTAVTNNSSGTLNINGNVTAGTLSNSNGVNNASTGSVVITGNVTAATGSGATNSSTGSLSVIGNVVAAAAGGISNATTGTLTITGNVTGGTSVNSYGVTNNAGGTVTITGNVTGSATVTSGEGIRNAGIGTINITGECFGALSPAVNNNVTGTVNITGNSTGGSVSSAFGVVNSSTGTTTIIGSATGSSVAVGAQNSSSGILNVKRAVGNGWGIGTVGISSVAGVGSLVAASQTRVEEFEFGALGQAPIAGAVSCPDLTTNVCIVHRLGTTKKTLVDSAASANYPAASNVRSGTSYNFGNTTGTLAVPAVGSVALGVAVDNTVGTAVLTPSAVWNALTSGMTTSGSIGERLKNAATVGTTGQALADALTPVP